MDPVSVAALILTTTTIISDVVKFARNAQKALGNDEKFNTLRYRLKAEQMLTTAWSNSLRRVPGDSLRDKIPAKDWKDVEEILEKLRETYQSTATKFGRMEADDGKRVTPSVLVYRMKWHASGYEDFKAMLDLIETLNKILNMVAPAPPLYSPPSTNAYPAGYTFQSGEAERLSGVGAPGIDLISTPEARIEQMPPPLSKPTTIEAIYTASLEGMRLLSVSPKTAHIGAQGAVLRLQLWGIGLFEGSLPLDTILEKGSKDYDQLRECLLNILVNIAVTEEHVLSETYHDLDEQTPQAKDTIATLSDLLGYEEVSERALHRWTSLLDDDNSSNCISQFMVSIVDLVETLYDLIPCIRCARLTFLIGAERETEPEPEPTPVSAPATADPGRSGQTLIERNIAQLRLIESVDQKYAGTITKIRESLEDWKDTAEEDRRIAIRAMLSPEVNKMQGEFNRSMQSWSDGRLDQKTRSIGSEDSGKVLEELVNLGHTSTRHLWDVTQG